MHEGVLLYIEDEDAVFLLFEEALKASHRQIELHRACDSKEAFLFLRGNGSGQHKPDLVILDLNLPGKGGLEVLAEMKDDVSLRDIPVVIFTSSALASDRRSSLNLGAQDYMAKPFSYDAFLDCVKTLCTYFPVGRTASAEE